MTTTMSSGSNSARNSMYENSLSSQTITVPDEFGPSFLSPTDSEFSEVEEDISIQYDVVNKGQAAQLGLELTSVIGNGMQQQ